jgi:hypothetical protein
LYDDAVPSAKKEKEKKKKVRRLARKMITPRWAADMTE